MSVNSNRPELWLVRHGESVANAGLATADYSAIPLTSNGEAQAEALAKACTTAPTWIGMSRYLRAQQTAHRIIQRYPETPTVELQVEEFTYLATERCVELNQVARQPLVDGYWSRMDPEYCDGDGAESYMDFRQRATEFLDWSLTQTGLGIVFTHEQFIRAVLIAGLCPRTASSVEAMQQFFAMRSSVAVPNCAIVRLKFERQRWWVGSIDRSHLEESTQCTVPESGEKLPN